MLPTALFCMLTLTSAVSASPNKKMEVLYHWKSVDFLFPNDRMRKQMISTGQFVPGNSIPLDVDTWQKDGDERVFVTIPKFNPGIPSTLNTVSPTKSGGYNLLAPYPNWSWHQQGNCSGITSVFRVQIDPCGRLWVLDTGTVNIFTTRDRICPPQLLAFSLVNDELSGRHRFESNVLKPETLVATVAVDVRDHHDRCEDTFVYIADVTGYGLIVFDARNSRSWRVTSRTMYPYPVYGRYFTNNVEFELMDGALGLGLAPVKRGTRTLYYHSFSSVRESWVSTELLKNQTNFLNGLNNVQNEFKFSDEARTSQAAPEAFDKNGNMYFGPVASNGISCWNSDTPYRKQDIHQLTQDDNILQFVTGIKVIENSKTQEEELWVMTDRFQLAMVGQMKPDELNFRILRSKLRDLTSGTKCHPSGPITFVPPSRPKRPYRPSLGYGRF